MSPEQFLNSVVHAYYGRIHARTTDNYDAARFSFDGVDRSAVFMRHSHAEYMAFFAAHYREFHTTWSLLADAESRALFVNLILYRMLGHHHVKIREDAGNAAEASLYAQAESIISGDSSLPINGIFGPLRRFSGVACDSETLTLDCWTANVVYTFLKRQYFLDRHGVRVQPEAGDVVLDLGACLGDTAVGFAARVGPTGHVYAFDPLPDHVAASRMNVEQNGYGERVTIVPKAVSKTSNAVESFDGRGANPAFRIAGHEAKLPLVSLDDFAAQAELTRVDFIKLDIEGAELNALEGAAAVIDRFKPKLAVSLYHRQEDFIAIPAYLAGRHPGYRFHLDHYTMHAEETVLFATPVKD